MRIGNNRSGRARRRDAPDYSYKCCKLLTISLIARRNASPLLTAAGRQGTVPHRPDAGREGPRGGVEAAGEWIRYPRYNLHPARPYTIITTGHLSGSLPGKEKF
jgi:hypothetical protein